MFTACHISEPGLWVPQVHADCNHNEIAALLLRSMGPTPAPAESSWVRLHEVSRDFVRLARRYDGNKWTHLETAFSYTGALRSRYVEAESSLRLDGPVTARDSYLRAFLKADKVNPVAKFQKPRMIFPRSPRYNLDLACRLKPFEHWLWGNLKSFGYFGVPPTRIVAKGLNQHRRANLIRRKMAQIPGCVVVEVDGKAFEAHLDVGHLRTEHSVYRAAYPRDKGLARLLREQLVLKGVTKGGVKFVREGCRASGDFNTGMGNTLVMLFVTLSVLKDMGLPTFDVLADGDNCLLFVPPGDLPAIQRDFAPFSLQYGHEMVLERPEVVLERVRFGQSAPCKVGSSWRMLRDWKKILSHGTSSHAHLRDPGFSARWLSGVARCELFLARGVPIVQRWAQSVITALGDVAPLPLDRYPEYRVLGVVEGALDGPVVTEGITGETRLSFFRAFGITPDDQVALENRVASLDVRLDCWNEVEPCGGWWDYPPGFVEPWFRAG
jgi:hypothetical protein